MKEKIANNLRLNLYITIVTGILNFIVNKYFAKYLGVDFLGLMRLFTQIIAYLSLAELGIGSAATYALYKPLIEKNYEQVSIIFSTINNFYKKVTFIIIFLGILLGLFLPFFVKSQINGEILYIYWFLYVINTGISYIFAKYIILFTANQRYGIVRKIQGIGRILSQLIQIITVIYYKSFFIFICIMICENLYNYYFYRKYYKENYFFIKIGTMRDKNIVKDMKNIFWHKIGALVVYNTDYIIISKFLSLATIGIYSSYLMVYQIIIALFNIITPVITPKIGIYIASTKDKNKIYNHWNELQTFFLFLSIVSILCCYELINPFIKLWLGEPYLLSQITVILILINLFIDITKIIVDTFKFSCGFFNDIYSPILESLINLTCSIYLVNRIGLNGVILGTVISNILIIFLLKPFLLFKKCFDKTFKDFIFYIIRIIILLISCISCVKYFIQYTEIKMNIFNWIQFLEKAILLGISIFILVFIIFLFDKSFRKGFKTIFLIKMRDRV